MSTPAIPRGMEPIAEAIGRFPEGATVEQIEKEVPAKSRGRNLIYALTRLVGLRVIAIDESVSPARYRLAAPTASAVSPAAGIAVAPPQTIPSPAAPPSAPAAELPSVPAERFDGTRAQTVENLTVSATNPAREQLPVSAASQGAFAPAPARETMPTLPAVTAPQPSHPTTPPSAPVVQAPVTSSAPTAAPSDATNAQFTELFEAVVYQIVAGIHTRVSALALLKQLAMVELPTMPERRAFVNDAKARLEALTAHDAEEYGIDPEQYVLWHGQYFGTNAAAAP